jgi:hypothetical protein
VMSTRGFRGGSSRVSAFRTVSCRSEAARQRRPSAFEGRKSRHTHRRGSLWRSRGAPSMACSAAPSASAYTARPSRTAVDSVW